MTICCTLFRSFWEFNLHGFGMHESFAADTIKVLTPETDHENDPVLWQLQNASSKETSHLKGLEIFHIYTSKLTHWTISRSELVAKKKLSMT